MIRPIKGLKQSDGRAQLGLGLALLLFGVVIIRSAWLSEDAFITFRTVDNFINGYGLTWNIAERVQVYTHPLWMFLVSACYFWTREIYYTSILLSITISLAAVWIFARCIAASTWAAMLGVVALANSKAFVDYSTSGLENPLTYLLLAVFAVLYLRSGSRGDKLIGLAFIFGLALLNRMDLLLVLGPGMLWCLWSEREKVGKWVWVVGVVPFGVWMLFSLFYYGFPFPNTAYAKLGTGVGADELFAKGLHYLIQSSRNDPLTPFILLAGVVLPIVRRDWRLCALAIGNFLYIAYVIKIGGDYMSGRFLAVPFLLSCIVLFSQYSFDDLKQRVGLVLCFFVVGLSGPFSPLLSGADYGLTTNQHALLVMDTRAVEYPHTGLLKALKKKKGEAFPDHWWAVRGRKLAEGDLDPLFSDGTGEGVFAERSSVHGRVVVAWANVGMSGFYAGPQAEIVDMISLTEPLLARLPAKDDPGTGAGHYGRIMPAGYLQTRVSGTNNISDPNLARYYEKLKIVVESELFSWARVNEIWRFNTGYYDHLIDFDFYRFPSPLQEALSTTRIRPGNPTDYIRLGEAYLDLDMEAEAMEALDRALQNNPLSFKNFYTIAIMLKENGLEDQSQLVFKQAIAIAPDYVAGLEQNGKYDESLEVLKRLALAHAHVWEESSQAEVTRIFKKIMDGPYTEVESKLYLQIGAFMDQIENFEDGLRAYAKALAVEPNNMAIRVSLGRSHYLLGDMLGAVGHFEQVLAVERNSVAAFSLGLAYLGLRREEVAHKTYDQALREFGPLEAERIGAVEDLKKLARRGEVGGATWEILKMLESN